MSASASTGSPTNYLGTILFLSHIIITLLFTTHITLSLYHQYQSHNPKNARPIKPLRSLILLSGTSFVTLSYHMLMFLITSYQNWDANSSLQDSESRVSVKSIWNWMLSSELFGDFAKELVSDGPSVLWTQIAVLGTWFWEIWIAGKAHESGLSPRKMFPFLILGQMLPISFTATLFILHLRLRLSFPLAQKFRQSPSNPQNPSQSSPKPFAIPLTIPTALLNAILLLLPSLLRSRHYSHFFIPGLLLTRLILLLPYSGFVLLADEDILRCMLLSGGFVVANMNILTKGYGIWDLTKGLWESGYAVRAMGWDAVVGVVVAAVVTRGFYAGR
ncbi:uncharacterized protein BDR25DRAFT_220259 [Lindgomyces ingoldianus]|uniref:Uncharacterized protein n=1 Tax=Lindgomyces ingoldianus TaxID=673940 RepID=A0ACB6R0Z7_9PLEO|nr:uncharacterized protein BDR25DRAFT_220259 [Lindgomyces ingoldianus]KAF2472493.1 hypothetical protein BDR25DRAFT_220259 [Lindgomyces ingoldianus]